MRARGIDPGETIGWADIERESPGVFRYIDCGTVESAKQERGLALLFDPLAHLHAIETPEEMHHNDVVGVFRAAEAALNIGMSRKGVASAAFDPGCARIMQKVRNLLETRALAERIACSLVGVGARVVEPTAAECRRALKVKFGAQRGKGQKLTVDQQIAKLIPLYVRDWPKRSNPHVRDAAAAAMWALGAAETAEAIERSRPAPTASAVDEALRVAARQHVCPPPGTYGPGDYGPDSFGGSDFE